MKQIDLKSKKIMKDKVLKIMANLFDLPIESIKLEDNLYALGVDSLDIIELTIEFEKEFNILMDDYEVANIDTINQLIEYINTRIDENKR